MHKYKTKYMIDSKNLWHCNQCNHTSLFMGQWLAKLFYGCKRERYPLNENYLDDVSTTDTSDYEYVRRGYSKYRKQKRVNKRCQYTKKQYKKPRQYYKPRIKKYEPVQSIEILDTDSPKNLYSSKDDKTVTKLYLNTKFKPSLSSLEIPSSGTNNECPARSLPNCYYISNSTIPPEVNPLSVSSDIKSEDIPSCCSKFLTALNSINKENCKTVIDNYNAIEQSNNRNKLPSQEVPNYDEIYPNRYYCRCRCHFTINNTIRPDKCPSLILCNPFQYQTIPNSENNRQKVYSTSNAASTPSLVYQNNPGYQCLMDELKHTLNQRQRNAENRNETLQSDRFNSCNTIQQKSETPNEEVNTPFQYTDVRECKSESSNSLRQLFSRRRVELVNRAYVKRNKLPKNKNLLK